MKEISRYDLTEKLYESRRTLVYRAIQKTTSQSVIIKTPNAADPTHDDIRRFENEYAMISRCDDPGIIRAIEMCINGNIPILVTEDTGGKTLIEDIAHNEMDISDFLGIAIRVSDAIGYLHRNGIIHKDINPDNIVFGRSRDSLKIIDFDIAAGIAREHQPAINPERLEGTLHYISPEQTGRMNRAIDFRTDYYSLGATFYRMLTGRTPFLTDDIVELIHSHIVLMPQPPHEVKPGIPAMLSRIIMKLMSKNAEDRYQSSIGLKSDLQKCLAMIEDTRAIHEFEPGEYDISETLSIPEKLYGRDVETRILFNEFDKVTDGRPGAIFFAGPSGIGKSYLINEIQKPLVRKCGYFISGKFDPYRRDTPYYAFIQAFQDIIRQILTESENALRSWRQAILESIGTNGRVITDIIPGLRLVIGEQPAVPELNPLERENRFNFVFQNFIRAFAAPQHPLVLFIDDLQWADDASLKLLKAMLADSGLGYILFIGAYRDNEISEAHPLSALIRELDKKEMRPLTFFLKPLDTAHIDRMLCDSLVKKRDDIADLSRLIKAKTGGNPFFAKEFLISLYKEKFITFSDGWFFNIDDIASADISDNVATLLTNRVNRLSGETLEILKLASCIGVSSEISMLSRLSSRSRREILSCLNDVINDGMIVKLEDTLIFSHDRIRDAVYSLIEKEDRAHIHHRISAHLMDSISDESIFAVVQHLNLAEDLISTEEERLRISELNLKAGLKAKRSAAFIAAYQFFSQALHMLPPDQWANNYELSLSIHSELCEASYLAGEHENAERYFMLVNEKAKTPLEKIRVYEVKISSLTALNRPAEALSTGIYALNMLGFKMPKSSSGANVLAELIKAKIFLRKKNIGELLKLKDLTDPALQSVARLLISCSEPAYIGTPKYLPIIILKLLNLSLNHGNSTYASYAYAFYGLILCGVMNDFEKGYEFGQLALDINEIFDARWLKCRVYFIFGNMINHWQRGIASGMDHLLTSYRSGSETGDYTFASYAVNHYLFHAFFTGEPLNIILDKFARYYETMKSYRQPSSSEAFELWYQLVSNLASETDQGSTLTGAYFDERDTVEQWIKGANFTAYVFYVVAKQIALFLNGQFAEAIRLSAEGEPRIDAVMGMIFVPEFYFYYSISMTSHYNSASSAERSQYMKKLRAIRKKMKLWNESVPVNYAHKHSLIEAEMCRIKSDTEKAADSYQKAVKLAAQNGFIQDEAIACELAAKFYHSIDLIRFSENYLRQAVRSYETWGARAKARDLMGAYGHIIRK